MRLILIILLSLINSCSHHELKHQLKRQEVQVLAVLISNSPTKIDIEGINRRLELYTSTFNMDPVVKKRFHFSGKLITLPETSFKTVINHVDDSVIHKIKDEINVLSLQSPDIIMILFPSQSKNSCLTHQSQGFNQNKQIYFCLEKFQDYSEARLDKSFSNLAIHKTFHGFGFNHELLNFRSKLYLEWQTGLPGFMGLPFITGNTAYDFFDLYINRDAAQWLLKSQDPFNCPHGDDQKTYCQATALKLKENDTDMAPPRLLAPNIEDDLDEDKIPNRLDLCHWNNIKLQSPFRLNHNRILLKDNETKPIILNFSSNLVKIQNVSWKPVEIIPGGWLNISQKKHRGSNRGISISPELLPKKSIDQVFKPLARIEVSYLYQGTEYVRPYYLQYESQQIPFALEKEWFSYHRYGCDAPANAEYGDSWSMSKFSIPKAIPRADDYDWDLDGTPDALDTLPTVAGKCFDSKVHGVPDTDGDGVCDFASYKIVQVPFMDARILLGEPDPYDGGDYCPQQKAKNTKHGCTEEIGPHKDKN
jgi:hypothetical protein